MNSFRYSLIALCLLLGTSIASAAGKVDCNDDSRYAEIDKSELKTKIVPLAKDRKAAIIDVNSAESFAKEKVDHAMHFEAVKTKLAQTLPADKNAPIVAYCGGPKCGAWKKAAKEACALGYTNIRHYKGGISGWTGSG